MELTILLLLVTFLYRALPRLFRPYAFSSDTYYHLYYAKLIRQARMRVPRRYPQMLLDHDSDYPFLLHWIWACFPLHWHFALERISTALWDTLSVGAVLIFGNWFTQFHGRTSLTTWPLWTAAILAFAPALLRIGSGPRAFSGTPRVMGETLYLLHMLLAFHGWQTHSPWTLVASLLMGSFLILSSKFANQVLLFFGFFLGLFVTPWYWLLLLGIYAGSIILSWGRALHLLEIQLKHLIFYKNTLQKIFIHPSHLPALQEYRKNLQEFFRQISQLKLTPAMRWCLRQEKYYWHLLVTVFPQFLCLPFFWLTDPFPPVGRYLLIWATAGLIWFILTKQKLLSFLGEGERYLEFALYPSIALITLICIQGNASWLLALWLAGSIAAALYYIGLFLDETVDDFTATQDLYNLLNSLPEGTVWPIAWYHWQTVFRCNKRVLTYGNIRALNPEEFELVLGRYPYPSEKYLKIILRYQINTVITSEDCLTRYTQHIIGNPAAFYACVENSWKAGNMVLLKLKPLPMLYRLFESTPDFQEQWRDVKSLRERQDYMGALTALEPLLMLMPANGTLLAARGEIELAAGDPQKAIASFRQVAKEDAAYLPACLGLARAQLFLNGYMEAEWAVNQVLRMQPNHAEAQEFLRHIQNRPERQSLLQQALDHCHLGALALAAHQAAEASRFFNATIQTTSTIMGCYFGRALSLLMLGRNAEAAEDLRTELRFHPECTAARDLFRALRSQKSQETNEAGLLHLKYEKWIAQLSFQIKS